MIGRTARSLKPRRRRADDTGHAPPRPRPHPARPPRRAARRLRRRARGADLGPDASERSVHFALPDGGAASFQLVADDWQWNHTPMSDPVTATGRVYPERPAPWELPPAPAPAPVAPAPAAAPAAAAPA